MASIAPNPARSSEDPASREREQHRAPRSDRVVCTACRQSKVRCTGTNHEPCSRCTRLGLDCRRDTNFKRVCKSKYESFNQPFKPKVRENFRKMAELEKQVEHLTSAFNGAVGQTPDVPGPMAGQLSASPSFWSPQYPTFSGVLNTGDSVAPLYVSATPSVAQLQLPDPPARAKNVFDLGIFSIFHASEDSPPPWAGAREPAKMPPLLSIRVPKQSRG